MYNALKKPFFYKKICTSHRKCDTLPLWDAQWADCRSIARGNRRSGANSQIKHTERITYMKKTLITLMALAGVAAASEVLTLPGSSDFTWIAGSTCNVTETVQVPDTSEGAEEGAMKEQTNTLNNIVGKATGQPIAAGCIENLAKQITSAGVDSIGWFGGTGQSYGANSYGADITVGTASFSFMSRPGLSGEYVALGLTKTFTASSITLSFTTDNKLGYSLWSYDAATTTATQLVGPTKVDAAGDVSVTYDTALVEPSQLFVVWSSNLENQHGSNVTIGVSNIQVEYVPEPATATLSLLALAGLAARRRRK